MPLQIVLATPQHANILTELVGELLKEIMKLTGENYFNIAPTATAARAKSFLEKESYIVFLAQDGKTSGALGFVALYEGYALYTEGPFGTIPELYVRENHRSSGIGTRLLEEASSFGRSRGWTRLEVTTPPIPPFEETLQFYERQGFSVTGGKKLKLLL